MAHSVTTTAAYVLSKYSRSYPSASSLGAQAPVESEWQHFSNPVMNIVLEAKKSPAGQLVSMRLRILWTLHTESSDLHADQREVVFEDLELLSFSSLPTSVAQSDQSLPLKAVYRDAVVGIRYLHPRIVPPGSLPTYRRFQITFKDALDASQFIDAIKSVCPCKANTQSAHINRHPTMLSASLTRTATTLSDATPLRSARLTDRQIIIPTAVDSRLPAPTTILGHPTRFVTPSIVATTVSSDDSAFVSCSETSHRAEIDRQRDILPTNRGGCDAAQSSLPNSSQPSSSDQSTTTMPPPPVPRHVAHDAMNQEPSRTAGTDDERSELLASLSKHSSLYELSRADLETLVSRVIREDGFLHLLESLDSLWRVKGFLGR